LNSSHRRLASGTPDETLAICTDGCNGGLSGTQIHEAGTTQPAWVVPKRGRVPGAAAQRSPCRLLDRRKT
jgi:hypothetical protein